MKRALLALLALGLLAGCASTVHSKASATAASSAPPSVPSVTTEISLPASQLIIDPPPTGLAQSAAQLALYATVAGACHSGQPPVGYSCGMTKPSSIKLASVTDTINRANKMTGTPAYVLTWNNTECVTIGPAPEPGESPASPLPPRMDCTMLMIDNAVTGEYVEGFQY